MLIKAGVDISRLNRETRRSLAKAAKVLKKYEEELVITSTYEGSHGESSLHYCNDAYDIRKPRDYAPDVAEEIREELGPFFDVVLEGDHVHIEFDPQ